MTQRCHGQAVTTVGGVASHLPAIVTSVLALRNVRGTSTPYGLAVALALVKVPLGALAAVLGLLLMSGGLIPRLSALDSSAQILAWVASSAPPSNS